MIFKKLATKIFKQLPAVVYNINQGCRIEMMVMVLRAKHVGNRVVLLLESTQIQYLLGKYLLLLSRQAAPSSV